MIIANGIILEDEKVFGALRAAGLIPDDGGKDGNILVGTEIPEGLMCASVDGDVGYPGIYVDLVEPSNVTPAKCFTHGIILSVTERPEPSKDTYIDKEDTAIRTRIYGDFTKDEYTCEEQYINVEYAFTEG